MGNLYIIEFSTGVIKVGKSSTNGSRERRHRVLAESMGIDVTRSWSTPEIVETDLLERVLIKFCSRYGVCRGGSLEYFSGLDFDNVQKFTEALIEHFVRRADDEDDSDDFMSEDTQDRDRTYYREYTKRRRSDLSLRDHEKYDEGVRIYKASLEEPGRPLSQRGLAEKLGMRNRVLAERIIKDVLDDLEEDSE